MKKAEAISILATSVRPREAKDRARYDEAVKMAIEALKSSEQTVESAQNVQDEDLISKLSEIRSEYNCFDEDGEPQYRALSEAIRILSQLADGDTISRQAAIDAAKDWYEGLICGSVNGLIKRLNALPTVQPEPKWIPCSVRLPDEGQKCLVCDKGSIGIDIYIGHGNPYNWKWYTRDYEAWMPLPAPYTEEKKE